MYWVQAKGRTVRNRKAAKNSLRDFLSVSPLVMKIGRCPHIAHSRRMQDRFSKLGKQLNSFAKSPKEKSMSDMYRDHRRTQAGDRSASGCGRWGCIVLWSCLLALPEGKVLGLVRQAKLFKHGRYFPGTWDRCKLCAEARLSDTHYYVPSIGSANVDEESKPHSVRRHWFFR